MSKQINLTIIIPHYNDSNRLIRLIKSIPQKDDIEIIVVDDHSDSNEFQRISEYINEDSHSYIYCMSNPNKENSAGLCRNEGIRHATGKWVIFADADDYFCDGMYEIVSKEFEDGEDIIFFPPNSIKEDGTYSDRHEAYQKIIKNYLIDKSQRSELYIRMIESPCSKMIRRELFINNDIVFDDTRYSNDVMFCTKTGAAARTVKAVDECIYMITEADGTLTKIHNRDSFDIRKQVLINRYSYIYHNLGKEKTLILGMRFAGLRYIVSPIKNGYGLSLSFKYLKMLIKERVPVIIL